MVQTSWASAEGGHRDNCITCLTLSFRKSLGIWPRGREGAYSHPQIEGSAAGLRKNKLRKISQPGLGETFPKVTLNIAFLFIYLFFVLFFGTSIDIAFLMYFLPGQRDQLPILSLLNWTTKCCCCCWVASVMFDSVRPHGRQPTRLLCPWDSPGKKTGMGCHFLLQDNKIDIWKKVCCLRVASSQLIWMPMK